MLNMDAESPSSHKIFPAKINVINADIFDVKLTTFTFPVAFSILSFPNLVNVSSKNVPVPGSVLCPV